MILVWGSLDDSPVAAMLDALSERSVDVEHLDDALLSELRYDIELAAEPSGWIELGGRTIDLAGVRGVYLRPGKQRPGAAATAATLLAVTESLPARVVNRPSGGRSNLSKPFQLELIAGASLATPETLVTSDPVAARAFLERHRRIVYKSISGVRSVVTAIELGTASAERIKQLGHGPAQLQRWIDGTDVRVHVVGERWFATSIASTATDYRYGGAGAAPPALAEHALPEGLGEKLVALTQRLGLLVSGIDLRRTPDGQWYCFEVNPSPGFTYYEAHTEQPIAAAIADLLCG